MSTPIPLAPAILLVDDEPDVRIILRRVLLAIADGSDLIALDNGAAALAMLQSRMVPLVVTDLNMPGMNGLALAEAVKAASPSTTVVLITAYQLSDLARKSHTKAIDHYLPKPFPFDQLEAIVRKALP